MMGRFDSFEDASRVRARAIADAKSILDRAGVLADIVIRSPKWLPGDVVVVTYAIGQPYTYVRGAETWPVDKGRTPKTDDDINRLYALGKVRPVLQAGGSQFNTARLR